ncbi:MAG: helix-turn-helix transcriptional regulator [Candidatus Aminicenantes bacterium]|nr:helix-turn-helix transcriptional regulator [Candidatus Aminicenantes bacterium]
MKRTEKKTTRWPEFRSPLPEFQKEKLETQGESQWEKEIAKKYIGIVGVIIVALNREGKITLINKRGCEIICYTAREIVMDFTLEDLGKNIKRIRTSLSSEAKPGKPMLQGEMARKSGIPAPSLCNIENGKYKNLTWEMLSKISRGLGVSIADLFASETKTISSSQIAINEMIDLIIEKRLEAILKEKALTEK